MAKPRRRKGSLRAATKVQEKGLQEVAERLARDPDLAVPLCRGHAGHFKKAERDVRRAWEVRGDDKRLAGFARGFFTHPFARAYAATLLVARDSEDSRIIMLQVRTPFGVLPVASRGKAKAMHVAALQHGEDRKARLLLVADLAKKQGLSFYSLPGEEGRVVCAGKDGPPPPEFVAAEAGALGLLKDPDGWACPHAIHAEERVVLRWRPAQVKLRRCAACVDERNMLHAIVQHIAARDLVAGFDVSVDLAPLPRKGEGGPALPTQVPVDAAALERYRKGELSDEGLLAAQRAARFAQLRELDGPLYVHGGVNYGADREAFLAALQPTLLEATALRGALTGWDKPVVLEKGSAAKILAELWKDRGLAALEAVAGSPEVARQVYEAHDVQAKGVGPALQQAQARGLREATDAALPSYRDLPPGAALADAVARARRAHGKAAALQLLEQSDDPALKGLVHALELALGAGQGQWKYNPHDLDVARQVRPHAEALLNAPPAQYHEALQALARATGSTEELRRA